MSTTVVVKDLLMKEVIRLLDKDLIIAQMANTKYEGELKRQGSTVSVQTFPNLNLQYGKTAGAAIVADSVTITSEDLEVDQVLQGGWTFTDLEQIQTNLDLLSKYASRIAYAMGNYYDAYIANEAVVKANSSNQIVPGAPVTLNNTAADADNVMTRIGQIAVKLRKQNAFQMPYLFVNPAVENLILDSNLYTAFDKGLGYRENGVVGKVKGMMVYSTNNLPVRYLLTMTGVAVADQTIVFTIAENDATSNTVTFTAKAAPSAAGEFDIAANTAAQVAIMIAMINGTGTPGATNYIALSAADRSLVKAANITATASGTDKILITMGETATLDTLSAGITNGTVGSKGYVLFACDKDSVNFVKQENGFKVDDLQGRFTSQVSVENAYGVKVFAENAKRISTIDVLNV